MGVARTTRPLDPRGQGLYIRPQLHLQRARHPRQSKTSGLLRSGLSNLEGRSLKSDIGGVGPEPFRHGQFGPSTEHLSARGPGPRRVTFQEAPPCRDLLGPVSRAWAGSDSP